jgi:hypothetical protein
MAVPSKTHDIRARAYRSDQVRHLVVRRGGGSLTSSRGGGSSCGAVLLALLGGLGRSSRVCGGAVLLVPLGCCGGAVLVTCDGLAIMPSTPGVRPAAHIDIPLFLRVQSS